MAIGLGWANGSWVDAGWESNAWASVAAAPTFVSASVSSDGNTTSITFSRAVTDGGAGLDGMVVTASGGAVTLSYVSGDGGVTLVYTNSRTIDYGEVLSNLTYTQPTNGIEALDDAQDVESFSGESVTNGSLVGFVDTTNQSGRQVAWRIVSGTSLNFNEDFLAYAATLGVTSGTFNERLIRVLQILLSSVKTNINDLKAEAAADRGKARYDDIGTDFTDIGS